jgi:hypothetical protein
VIPTPIPVGLVLCDYVLVEQTTRKVSLIGSFWEVGMRRFPEILPPFFVYAALTDGQGTGTLELVVSRLETDEEVFTYRRPITFPDHGRVACAFASTELLDPSFGSLSIPSVGGRGSGGPATIASVFERRSPMSESEPTNNPTPRESDEQQAFTHDLNSMDLFEDVVGDTTVRPLRPGLREQIRPKPELLRQTRPPQKPEES